MATTTPAVQTSQPIQIRDVSKVYEAADSTSVHALDRISLDVRPGEFVAIVGPSGCGKSTLLRIVAGLDHATKGAVRIDGVNVDKPTANAGFVFQAAVLLPWRSVLANVTLPMVVKRKAGREATERAPRPVRKPSGWGSRTSTPASFPAACNNASPSPARWYPTRRCC